MIPPTLRSMIAGAAIPLMAAAAVAQVPPVSPPPPKEPKAAVKPLEPFHFKDKFELEYQADLLRQHAVDLRFEAEKLRHADMEALALHAREMALQTKEMVHLDVEHVRRAAEELRLHGIGDAKVDLNRVRAETEAVRRYALLDMPRKFEGVAGGVQGGMFSEKLLNARPRAPWAQGDPADSLYRTAREALNRGEYRRAAQLFNEVTKKYPRSVYALDCTYWEAFARYRSGNTDDLRQALRILDDAKAQLAQLRSDNNVDVQALRARVQGALAARGDQKAAEDLKREAAQTGGCDREEISVRAEALAALGQMDRAAAIPSVKKVLARRDICTVELRRRALFVLARDPDAEAVSLIIDVAKNDPDQGIRGEAMRWLPRVAGDNAVPQLEELLRTSMDEQAQRSAISALGSIDSERARKAVRAIIERTDVAERVRYEAIIGLSRERENRNISPEEQQYLRSLYSKLEAARLREAVLTSVSRIETPENEQFLLSVARNQNETPSLRSSALQRLGRMNSVGVADIAKLYDVADARSLREQILHALAQRKEPEAIDKLIEVARRDTDPQIRRTAIQLLGRSNNPRAIQAIAELIDK
jgi:HEAT repeat protein/TolA-binding protein